jgi:hypothetical protein
MKSKVFVSCGQHTDEEKQVAKDICVLLDSLGFETYLAISVQTITEINAGIIGELKNSDSYLLINFCREPLDNGTCRGSLFSHQELAIAYALGFERLLIVNQQGVAIEGMLRYIGNNTETFQDISDCCVVVQRAIKRAGWTPDYSRRLHSGDLRWERGPINYHSLTGHTLTGQFLYLDIKNDRPDVAALGATARLAAFGKVGEPLQPSPIRSPLKATARPGFSHTIFPQSHEAFDLLCIGSMHSATVAVVASTHAVMPTLAPKATPQVFLNCALDIHPIPALAIAPGTWILEYEFFAIGFPILTVLIELNFPSTGDPTARIISESNR